MKLLRQEEGGLVLYCIGHGQNECCVKLNTHNYRDTEVVDNQLLDMMNPAEKWTVH